MVDLHDELLSRLVLFYWVYIIPDIVSVLLLILARFLMAWSKHDNTVPL